MADNIQLNVGVGGAVAASDEIGGVHFQRIKLIHGADGTNKGDISEDNPLPVVDIDFITKRRAVVSPYGSVRSDETTRLLGGLFEGSTLDAQVWTSTPANGGTATLAGGMMTMQTNTTANGSILVTSNRVARYMSGIPNLYLGEVKLGDTGGGNNTRRWGIFDSANGLFFELLEASLSVVRRKNSVDTRVSSLNGPNAFVLDTNFHTYEIYYTGGTAYFIQDFKLIHTESHNTSAICDTMSLKIAYENKNTGGSTTQRVMETRSGSVSRFGQPNCRPAFYNTTAAETRTLKTGAGTLQRVIINKKGSGSGAITFYDNTAGSGTVIGSVDTVNPCGAVLDFNLDFSIGLTYVSAATLGDVTVIYD